MGRQQWKSRMCHVGYALIELLENVTRKLERECHHVNTLNSHGKREIAERQRFKVKSQFLSEKKIDIEIDPMDKIEQIKEGIEEEIGIPSDDLTAEHYNRLRGSVIHRF